MTLVIDGRSHILSVTAQRMPDGVILLEMAPMDNQRRLSQEQLQHAQQVAARHLVAAWHMRLKIRLAVYVARRSCSAKRYLTHHYSNIPK